MEPVVRLEYREVVQLNRRFGRLYAQENSLEEEEEDSEEDGGRC